MIPKGIGAGSGMGICPLFHRHFLITAAGSRALTVHRPMVQYKPSPRNWSPPAPGSHSNTPETAYWSPSAPGTHAHIPETAHWSPFAPGTHARIPENAQCNQYTLLHFQNFFDSFIWGKRSRICKKNCLGKPYIHLCVYRKCKAVWPPMVYVLHTSLIALVYGSTPGILSNILILEVYLALGINTPHTIYICICALGCSDFQSWHSLHCP